MLNEATRYNAINVEEYKNLSVSTLRNNKVDIIEKELFKIKLLVTDLRTDAERVCLEHNKLKTKCSGSELRHKDLVEKLKDELLRSMLVQQKEENFEEDDMMNKIDE